MYYVNVERKDLFQLTNHVIKKSTNVQFCLSSLICTLVHLMISIKRLKVDQSRKSRDHEFRRESQWAEIAAIGICHHLITCFTYFYAPKIIPSCTVTVKKWSFGYIIAIKNIYFSTIIKQGLESSALLVVQLHSNQII